MVCILHLISVDCYRLKELKKVFDRLIHNVVNLNATQIWALFTVGIFLLANIIHTIFQSRIPYLASLYILGFAVILIAAATQRSGLAGLSNTLAIIATFLLLIILSIVLIVLNFLNPETPGIFKISLQTLMHHYPLISSIPFLVFLIFAFAAE